MLRTQFAALLGGLALSLAACEQVRLPGLNPAQPDPERSDRQATGGYTEADLLPTAEELAAERTEAEATPPAPAGRLAETPAAAQTTVDTIEAPGEGPLPAGAGREPNGSPSSALALVNASQCVLPEGAAPTPTVAMAAGATELEEPVMGAEAVNALSASLSAFPGIVKLEPRRTEPTGLIASGHCGALRIAPNWFVTAAHCIDEPFDEIRVIGEAANLRSPQARRAPADYAICHAGYQGAENGYANDIALIRMTSAQVAALGNVPVARFGATQAPLAPANYAFAEMAGWGVTQFDGQLSSELLTTRLKITRAGPAAITVSSDNGAGPCIGDSGGPLYVTETDGSKTAVGILSVVEQNPVTGTFCEGDYDGRYTSLQGYAGWISGVIALCEKDEAACR